HGYPALEAQGPSTMWRASAVRKIDRVDAAADPVLTWTNSTACPMSEETASCARAACLVLNGSPPRYSRTAPLAFDTGRLADGVRSASITADWTLSFEITGAKHTVPICPSDSTFKIL